MSLLPLVGVAWAATVIVLIGMMIHRTILGFREEDQLFLAAGDAALATEQVRLAERMNRLTRYIHAVAWTSGALLATMFGTAAFLVIRQLN
jgi:hypothetical protein